jgi:predicted DNA-binding protein
MKKRGGYAGNLECQVKVRISRDTYEKLQRLSGVEDKTIARVIRSFITAGLEERKTC